MWCKRQSVMLAAGLLVLGLAGCATSPNAAPKSVGSPLVETSPNSDGPIEGFFADEPAEMAASQIVPATYRIDFIDDTARETVVSWKGGPSWRRVLVDSMDAAQLMVTFGKDTVTIGVRPPWKRLDYWEARHGDDYASVVREWGERIGINPVIHDEVHYPVETDLKFRRTDFITAVTKLTQSFARAPQAPLVDIWDDDENFAVEITAGGVAH